jgi:hypothetical protein
MADLGSAGVVADRVPIQQLQVGGVAGLRVVTSLPMDLPWRSGRDDTDGSPEPPCFFLFGRNRFGPIDIPIATPGTYTVSVDLRYHPNEAPRPVVTVDAEPVGGTVVSGAAPSGTGWVTVSLPVVARTPGAAHLWVETRHPQQVWCRIDHLTVA